MQFLIFYYEQQHKKPYNITDGVKDRLKAPDFGDETELRISLHGERWVVVNDQTTGGSTPDTFHPQRPK